LTCHGLRIAIAPCGFGRPRIHPWFSRHCGQITAAKIRRNRVFENAFLSQGEPEMRIKHAIFFGSVAALAVLAAPSLARNTEAQRTGEQRTSTSPSPTCQSYQLAPDGSWKQLPCREFGSGDGSQHKPSPPNVDDGEH
jgi:hypothetical protein